MSKIEFPSDTIMKVEFPPVESDHWSGKKKLVLAFTLSRGWLALEKSGWINVDQFSGLEKLRELISSTWDQRVADIFIATEGGDELEK